MTHATVHFKQTSLDICPPPLQAASAIRSNTPQLAFRNARTYFHFNYVFPTSVSPSTQSVTLRSLSVFPRCHITHALPARSAGRRLFIAHRKQCNISGQRGPGLRGSYSCVIMLLLPNAINHCTSSVTTIFLYSLYSTSINVS